MGSPASIETRTKNGSGPLPDGLLRPPDEEMCPPGFCIVHPYRRADGTPVPWHLRKLIAKDAARLRSENMRYIFWNSRRQYPRIGDIHSYGSAGSEFDAPIQFWLEYWRSKGIPLEGVDPLFVKAIIAGESSFNPNAHPKGHGTATGLMQLLDRSWRILAGERSKKDGWQEIPTDQVLLQGKDRFDPVLNIGAGIRWLGHKQLQLPKSQRRDLAALLKRYHGDTPAKNEAYARKILKLYRESQRRG